MYCSTTQSQKKAVMKARFQ